MADARQIQMRKECIEKISYSLGRQITPAESAKMLADIKSCMVQARNANPEQWATLSLQERSDAAAKLYKESKKIEAEKIKQRAYLTVQAQKRIENRLRFHRSRGYKGYSAGVQVLQEVDRLVKAAQSDATEGFLEALDGKQKGVLGLVEDRTLQRQVVRETYGEDTGSQIAKDIAEEYRKSSQGLVDRFNRAGGSMGKLEHYIPQTHSVSKLLRAKEILFNTPAYKQIGSIVARTWKGVSNFDQSKAAWVAYVAPRLDRSNWIDINGNPMTDGDYYRALGDVFDTIVTDGQVDFDTSMVSGQHGRGGAGRANRGDQHRMLHFQSAEDFLEYQQIFGDGTIFLNMLGGLKRTAKDCVLLESLGPNPNNSVRGLSRVCGAEVANSIKQTAGQIKLWSDLKNGVSEYFFNRVWGTLNGDATCPALGKEGIAALSAGARNLEVVGKLQSTMLSSISDIPSYFISAHMNKISALTAATNLIRAWGKNSRAIASRGGLMADAIASNIQRFGQNSLGAGWTGMLANATMKLSLLDAFTNGVRRASMINMMGMMADVVKYDWKGLTGYQKRSLERIGVTEKDWWIWSHAKPFEQDGARYLTRDDIREVDLEAIRGDELNQLTSPDALTQRDLDHAVTTYMAFIQDESGIASLAPDLTTRSIPNIAGNAGTFWGEVVRNLMLFKSFPIGFMRRHLERMSDLAQTEGQASRVKYAASIFVMSTLAGAISVQLKALAAGRDFQDPTSQDFWLQAMSVGGGAGFLTDILVAGLDGENAYGSPNFLRFMGPVVGTVLDTFDVGKSYYNEFKDELNGGLYNRTSTADSKALRLIRGHAPFVNLWYLKGIFDRAIYNDLMEATSPGYNARVQTWAIRNLGQEYWWDPQEIIPSRLPGIATAPRD